MYVKLKTARQAGLKINMTKDALTIEGENHWSDEQLEKFNVFAESLSLHDRDCDRVGQYIADLTVMRTLRQIAL
jgi:hypothetical protein